MSHVTPVDALPVINQISRATPTKSEDAFFFRASPDTDGSSSIALEVHCIRVITQNDAIGDARYDEFATYSNSTSDESVYNHEAEMVIERIEAGAEFEPLMVWSGPHTEESEGMHVWTNSDGFDFF